MRNIIRAAIVAISTVLSCGVASARPLSPAWDAEFARMDRVERGQAELARLIAAGEW